MLSKKIVVFVCTLFIASAVLPVLGTSNDFNMVNIEADNRTIFIINEENTPPAGNIISLNSDELDQYQETPGNSLLFVCKDYTVAQSFVPTYPTLTRVEVMLFKWIGQVNFEVTVSIREDLGGEDLTQLSLVPDISQGNQVWVEYDFEDISIIPGNTYYIVCSATEGSPDEGGRLMTYGWSFSADSSSYPDGGSYTMGLATGFVWSSGSYDCCFRTYGIPNNSPSKPTITGETNGNNGESYEYKFSSVDPDGDDIYYWILWFEGCPGVSWDGPYSSGEEITKSYTWEDEGTFTIQVKVKDDKGAESEWTTLQVTMPKNKLVNNLNSWIDRLIERFPILKLIL